MVKPTNPFKKTFSAPALPLIALFFLTGAALKTGEVIAALDSEKKIVEPTQMAIADPSPDHGPAEENHDTPTTDQPQDQASSKAMAPAHTSKKSSPMMAGETCVSEQMIAAIKDRSQALEQQEAQIASRARALEIVEKRVASEITRLEQNRQSLQRILAEARTESSEDIKRLIQIYANMKPKQAAIIFDEMAPEIAAGFIRRMRGNAASFILANMDSKKAYAITLMIAGAEAPFQTN